MSTDSLGHEYEIATATSSDYLTGTCVALTSAHAGTHRERKSESTKHRVIIFHDGLQKEIRESASHLLDRLCPTFSIDWVDISNDPQCKAASIAGTAIGKAAQPAKFARLLLGDHARSTKVIYLDSDVLVTGNIRKLAEINLDGKILGAVQDEAYATLIDDIENSEKLGLDPEGPYFNSGILAIDMERWQEERVGQWGFEFITHNAAESTFNDQSALNVALSGKWHPLSSHWNAISPGDGDYVVDHPDASILHFASRFKPWRTFRAHPWYEIYWEWLIAIGLPISNEIVRDRVQYEVLGRDITKMKWSRRGALLSGRTHRADEIKKKIVSAHEERQAMSKLY